MKNARAGGRTRVNWLEASYTNHCTTHAHRFIIEYWFKSFIVFIKRTRKDSNLRPLG